MKYVASTVCLLHFESFCLSFEKQQRVWCWNGRIISSYLVPRLSPVEIYIFRWVIELRIIFKYIPNFTSTPYARYLHCHSISTVHTEVLKSYISCRGKCLNAFVFPPISLCKWNLCNCNLILSIFFFCLCFLITSKAGRWHQLRKGEFYVRDKQKDRGKKKKELECHIVIYQMSENPERKA